MKKEKRIFAVQDETFRALELFIPIHYALEYDEDFDPSIFQYKRTGDFVLDRMRRIGRKTAVWKHAAFVLGGEASIGRLTRYAMMAERVASSAVYHVKGGAVR